jgi:hypothetical protein
MRRVELYLARARETKGACAGGANTLVTSGFWVDGGCRGLLLIPDTRCLIPEGPTVMGSSD